MRSTITSAATTSVIFESSPSAARSSSFAFPTPAPWLADVQRRLINSVGTAHDGQWLSASVVSTANLFFQATSDMFQAEPHLQSSLHGNLVAEFRGQLGAVTLVVSDESALVMATIKGEPVQSKLTLAGTLPGDWRDQVAKFTDALRVDQNGRMDSER